MLVFKLKASCHRQGSGLVEDNGELPFRPLIKAEGQHSHAWYGTVCLHPQPSAETNSRNLGFMTMYLACSAIRGWGVFCTNFLGQTVSAARDHDHVVHQSTSAISQTQCAADRHGCAALTGAGMCAVYSEQLEWLPGGSEISEESNCNFQKSQQG